MTSPLAKAAGPIALVAGVVFAAVDVAACSPRTGACERIEMMRQTPFIVTNALYWVVFIGLVLALVSVYFRLGGRAGGLGAVGLLFRAGGHPGHGGQHVVRRLCRPLDRRRRARRHPRRRIRNAGGRRPLQLCPVSHSAG